MIGQVYEMECQGYHYVGVHCGDVIKDNYYGSGIAWLNVVNKYGKDNVKRTILSYFHSKAERDKKEKFYIKECKNTYGKLCLNIAEGGQGGNLGDEVNKKISQKVSGKGNGMYSYIL